MLTIGNDRRKISYVIKTPDDIDMYPPYWLSSKEGTYHYQISPIGALLFLLFHIIFVYVDHDMILFAQLFLYLMFQFF